MICSALSGHDFAHYVQNYKTENTSTNYNAFISGSKVLLTYSSLALVGFGAHTVKQGLTQTHLPASRREVKIITGSIVLAIGGTASAIILANIL